MDFASSILIWEPWKFTSFSLSNSSYTCFGADTNTYSLACPVLSFIGILREQVPLKYLVVFSPKSSARSFSLTPRFKFPIYNLLTFFSCFVRIVWFYECLYLLYFPYFLLHFECYSCVLMTRILASILSLIVSLEWLVESLVMTIQTHLSLTDLSEESLNFLLGFHKIGNESHLKYL